ncbi:hypothetical protein QHH03_28600 [Aphanizomenon sp. 202]|nr:hypothetical protein [Aphanizomenon sp. 202]
MTEADVETVTGGATKFSKIRGTPMATNAEGSSVVKVVPVTQVHVCIRSSEWSRELGVAPRDAAEE